MGNDVAAALRNGAGHVVAVEIVPLIPVSGGNRTERPYSSPRVVPVVNDARSYIENGKEHFDLIVYSLLDSHTNVSNYSSVRIDNYVYTVEAIEAARRLLKNDGILVLKFQAHTSWIAGRLHGLLRTVFAQEPSAPTLTLRNTAVVDISSSSGLKTFGTGFVRGTDGLSQVTQRGPAGIRSPHHGRLAYFYQHNWHTPIIVIMSSATSRADRLIWKPGAAGQAINWHFFFLGAGFLLLEAQIVSRMAMLFGTTWLVNSIVIAAILLLIVAVNFLVEFWRAVSVRLAYVGIGVCMLVSYFLPLEKLFFQTFWVKALLATLVLCSPVAFASSVFIRSFAEYKFNGQALGSNLLGALVGGMLESASLWTGIRSLIILAAVLYLLSLLFLRTTKNGNASPIPAEASPI
jgi:hypothetical protein